jgi:hypothetical protein
MPLKGIDIPLPSRRRVDYRFTRTVPTPKKKGDMPAQIALDKAIEQAAKEYLEAIGVKRGRGLVQDGTNWDMRCTPSELASGPEWTIGIRAIGVADARKRWDSDDRADALLACVAVFRPGAELADVRAVMAWSVLDAQNEVGRFDPGVVERAREVEGTALVEVPWSKYTAAQKKLVTDKEWSRVPDEG